ncbi:histone acetyltransferase 1, partial [Phenoliferia sp. Uapishka_3]
RVTSCLSVASRPPSKLLTKPLSLSLSLSLSLFLPVRSAEEVAQLSPEEQEQLVSSFSPAFVYPIFGQEETIFGYRSLSIRYLFASGSLNQYLAISYEAKFPETGDVKADDPEQILYEFIPPSYKKVIGDFMDVVEKDAREFRPCGSRIGAYRIRNEDDEERRSKAKGKGKGKAMKAPSLPERAWEVVEEGQETEEEEVVYEAYSANWDTPGFKEYHRRMQIFVLLFIEGATYIEEDDSRWEFLTLFERRKRGTSYSYHFIGFTSFYSFFCWPDTKRLRLSSAAVMSDTSGGRAFARFSSPCPFRTFSRSYPPQGWRPTLMSNVLAFSTLHARRSSVETLETTYKEDSSVVNVPGGYQTTPSNVAVGGKVDRLRRDGVDGGTTQFIGDLAKFRSKMNGFGIPVGISEDWDRNSGSTQMNSSSGAGLGWVGKLVQENTDIVHAHVMPYYHPETAPEISDAFPYIEVYIKWLRTCVQQPIFITETMWASSDTGHSRGYDDDQIGISEFKTYWEWYADNCKLFKQGFGLVGSDGDSKISGFHPKSC